MSKLDLIWALEGHNNKLEKLKEKLDELNKNLEIGNSNKVIKEKEAKIIKHKDKLNNTKELIRKDEKHLKEIAYKNKEINDNLYNGKTQDIKELEYWNTEKENILKESDIYETNIIQFMELEEELEVDIKRIEKELVSLETELPLLERKLEIEILDLTDEIEEENLLISKIASDIEQEDLDIYYNIRKTKPKAIVGVEDYICLGCNVRIPTYFGTNLKARDKLVFCESCSRILYYLK